MITDSKLSFCTCGPFRPKWMKMVDNIYKSSPNDNSSHSKLVYFCVRKPEKLDRIAAYLQHHLSNNLNRKNYINLNLTMDAINSLMNACHTQRLNLFVVNFLKMIQLLLESNVPDLQLLGGRSFVQFSQISEDTPNYHREYDYLINHFAKMAHDNSANESDKNKLRVAGIKGIYGVVRKSTMDQLQANVLDGRCLNMILPALLFNMHLPDPNTREDSNFDEDPSTEAIFVFKDIICRASFSNIQPLISTIFTYIDQNKLWTPSDFTLFVMDNFLENIRNPQAAHALMKQLVSHLGNEHHQFTTQERTGIVKAINKTVISLASQAVGPDIFLNFKSLLQILRQSIESTANQQSLRKAENKSMNTETGAVDQSVDNQDSEKVFQEAIIATIAEFAKNLPDTQKIEIMKFILNFDSMYFDKANRSKQLIRVLLKTMLQVATQYKTGSISNIFNSDFLNLLLNGVAVDRDPGNRIFVQKILHTLIDRHNNSRHLNEIRIYTRESLLDSLQIQKPSRQDIIFMKKTGAIIIENLFVQIIDQTNKVDNLEHIYCTLCLIALEMGADQVVVDLFRLIFGAQSYISDPNNRMPVTHQCAIHALLAAFITMLSLIVELNNVYQHSNEVIRLRQTKAKYFLPDLAFNRSNTANIYPTKIELDEKLVFSEALVKEQLNNCGYDLSTFDIPFHAKAGEQRTLLQLNGIGNILDMALDEFHELPDLSVSTTSLSISDNDSTIHENDDKTMTENNDNPCSFESFQKLLKETSDERKQRKRNKEIEMNKYFREVGFEKICKDEREKYIPIRQKFLEVLTNSPRTNERYGTGEYYENGYIASDVPDIWEIDYPKLFVA